MKSAAVFLIEVDLAYFLLEKVLYEAVLQVNLNRVLLRICFHAHNEFYHPK